MSNVSSSNGLGKYPKLRFKGFSEPHIVRKIGAFAKCYAGATPSTKIKSFWENGTIPWLSSGEVNKKHIYFTDTFITQSGFDNCSTKMVPSGTVVMALAGQGKTRGTVAITNIDLCTNQSLAAIVTDDTVCDLCLLYYLETQYENLRAVSSGDGTRGGLNLQIIADYPVCLPSVDEQIKIADFFAVLDRKIDKQRALIDSLKKYKRGVSRAIFTQEIRLLPDAGDWCQTEVGNICEIIMGQSPDSDSYNTDGVGVPLVQGNADMCNGITSPKRFTNKPTKICETGSIILSVRAPVGAVGRADRQICIGRGVCAINTDNNDYLYHFLATNESYWKHIEQGGTFTAISGDDIASMPVLYPPIEEREKIAHFLNLIDAEVHVAETTEIALLTLKNSLLKNLFI